ncbi:MAG: flagellin [Pseudomonadota bacterium]
MSSFSLGDLAQNFMLQRRGAALKAEMSRLNEELATGQVSDVKAILTGNVSYLADLENDLRSLSGFKVATTEATQFTDAVQLALDRVDQSMETFGSKLLSVTSSSVGAVLDQFSADAEDELAAVVNTLNTSVGGRSIFSGTATDQQALQNSELILNGLRAAMSGATTSQDMQTAADQWFSDPAGFAATIYNGSDTHISPLRLADGETVRVQLKADDPVFQDVLKNLALSALASDASFGLGADEQQDLLSNTGQAILQSKDDLIAVRADVGSAQARIDELATRNATEETSLEYAKGSLLAADPYETATELEAVQFQLQSLYAVTARMSDLSFVNFIR